MDANTKKALKNFFLAYKDDIKVGWFNDKLRKVPKWNMDTKKYELGNYAGGPTRKSGSVSAFGFSVFEVIKSLQKGGRDVLNKPFEGSPSPELKNILAIMAAPRIKTVSFKKRMINLAKSLIMVPMLKGKYKKESPETIKEKGFSRPTIDTGQTVKGVSAKYEKRNSGQPL